jgi:hypothetical protein
MAIAFPMPIPVPNTVFAFLNMYSTSNLEEVFEKMREEFVQDRKTIIESENRVRKIRLGTVEAESQVFLRIIVLLFISVL